MPMPKRIVLGSGKLYIVEYTDAIPDDNVIETDGNRFGAIQGGASIEYSAETYTAKDDLGEVVKTIFTSEDVLLKSGIMTIDAYNLAKLCATARVIEDAQKKTRTLKIGGIGNQNGKRYLLRFTHEDKQDGTVRITIVGKNTAGFTIAFQKDKETVVDAEFAAEPLDDEGTLVIWEEEMKDAPVTASSQEQNKEVV